MHRRFVFIKTYYNQTGTFFLASQLQLNILQELAAKKFSSLLGERMQNKVSLSVIISSLILTFLFQNCGQPSMSSSKDQIVDGVQRIPSSESERVIDQTSSFNKVIYYKASEVFSRTGPEGQKLQLDLGSGSMRLVQVKGLDAAESAATIRDCEIEPRRLENLSSLLETSRLCTDNHEPSADSVNCEAQAVSDIELISDQSGSSVKLLENICHSGLFLCGDADQKLRDSLQDLTMNPPAKCRE